MKSPRTGCFLLSSLAVIWIAQADDQLFVNCESAIASADADSNSILTTTEYANFLADFLSMCSAYTSGAALTASQYSAFNALCVVQNGFVTCADPTTTTVDYSSGTVDASLICSSAVGAALIDGCDPTQSIVQFPTLPPQSLSPDFDVEECIDELSQADGDQNNLLARMEYSEFLAIRRPECYATGEMLTPTQEAVYLGFSCYSCFQQTQNATCCLGADVGISLEGARNASDQQTVTTLVAVCGSADTASVADCATDGTTTTPLPPAFPSTVQPSAPITQPTGTTTAPNSAPATIPNDNSPSPTRTPGGDSPTISPTDIPPSDSSSALTVLSWNGMFGMFITTLWTIMMTKTLF
jgi:hypothetical protein